MRERQLTEHFAERAADEGLLDVAYTTTDSPFGPLLLAATPARRSSGSACRPRTPTSCSQDLAARVSPRVLEAPARLDEARRELDLYFEGRLRDFDLPLDWRSARTSAAAPCARSPASPTGRPAATRRSPTAPATSGRCAPPARACGSNPIPIVVPCHRVLRTGGGLGGYGGGLPMKGPLLEDWRAALDEGVTG